MSERNIIFFGETGTGKSSAINLLLNAGPDTSGPAPVSGDAQPCTPANTSYTTTLNGTKYKLWDTRGLGGGRTGNFFRAFFGRGPEKEFKKFLKERHRNHEIDLLVYCVRASRATKASEKYYNSFCAITRRLVAPVVIVVTQAEKVGMEDWWSRNSSCFQEPGMAFDGHACITTLQGNEWQAESRERLIDLISRDYGWRVKGSGSYFGSPVDKPVPSSSPPVGGISSLFRMNRSNANNGGPKPRPRNDSHPFSTSSSAKDSSFYTANSPGESMPSSPIVEPPTPCCETASIKSRVDTIVQRVCEKSPGEETRCSGSSLGSIQYDSPRSSYTLHSELQLQAFTEPNEDDSSELPFKHSTSVIRKRKSYPTRHGGFGDIWECNLISGNSSRLVAVKAVRADANGKDLKSHEKALHRELRIWVKLRHKNVVPLLGVVSGFGPLPSMVSPWFNNGSLSHYLEHHQISNLSEKHRLLGDIAAGLSYLHNENVIHGDLHSDNVLIDDHGTACLTDFGLSLISDFVGTSYLKSCICGGVQFADPALVQRVNSTSGLFYPTKPCDVYSFGGLVLHVMTGKKPYDGIAIGSIFLKVLKGKRPRIPTHITQWHKEMIRKCWDQEEHERPSADDLVSFFNQQ